MDFDHLFDTIATLVLHHSPSGMETEIDRFLLERFQELGLETWQDQAGNVIGKIKGRDSTKKIAMRMCRLHHFNDMADYTENKL